MTLALLPDATSGVCIGADLRGANLVGADLRGANLRYADLTGADLRYANLSADMITANMIIADLSGADLSGTDLRYANLSAANLSAANLSAADLGIADLRYAVLTGANLSAANLRGANLSAALLRGADLIGANLSYANLSYAHLLGVNLSGADLSGTNLSDARLSDANMIIADLSGANLSGANLSGANLSDANLSGAELSGANLSGAELLDANLSGAWRFTCPDCGAGYWDDYDADICCDHGACDCDDCIEAAGNLHAYDWSPTQLTFHGREDRTVDRRGDKYPPAPTAEPYLGLEIEVEGIHCTPETIADIWERSGFGWATTDGSLSEEGVELCTEPHTYARLASSSLPSVLGDIRSAGGRAWAPGTCGLHIHVSRPAFTTRSHAWRFAYLHTVLSSPLRRLSGRNESAYAWCKWPDQTDTNGQMATKVIARKAHNNDRYVAVNVVGDEYGTIELRYWRGNLNPTHVIGACAIADAFYRWSERMTLREVREVTWDAFAEFAYHALPVEQVKHIADLCKLRGVKFDDPTIPVLFVDTVRAPVMAESDV